uniref:Uncharacterized protein n=1 Tax=Ditylenchus dipsaci TaxID=166011 RepID=A0A915DJ69_9BILA
MQLLSVIDGICKQEIFDFAINEFNLRYASDGHLKLFPLVLQQPDQIFIKDANKAISNVYDAPKLELDKSNQSSDTYFGKHELRAANFRKKQANAKEYW